MTSATDMIKFFGNVTADFSAGGFFPEICTTHFFDASSKIQAPLTQTVLTFFSNTIPVQRCFNPTTVAVLTGVISLTSLVAITCIFNRCCRRA